MAAALIKTTFAIITPESAMEGDYAERGWIDSEGQACTFREAYNLLKETEASSGEFHPGVWYTDYNYSENYTTGGAESRSYHVEASVNFQRRLFNALKINIDSKLETR